ncbi:hypothetical protein L1987_86622 [Smallanthus sonchifolius]|uniref:Uncharacterized protein n=1 Tax=Smallanthus sonchifolius TaxID=185202 RepID=A0ACB8XZ48_9ASTR|nr:hypothetical protein L1987_86622 [Smallanthus sonchifolius]
MYPRVLFIKLLDSRNLFTIHRVRVRVWQQWWQSKRIETFPLNTRRGLKATGESDEWDGSRPPLNFHKVTFAECNLDFHDLTGYHPRNCDKFYHLIPLLGDCCKISDFVKIPVFSLQVTIFSNCGVSFGMSIHHSLVAASTQFNFLKAWTSIARFVTDESFLRNGTLPVYERLVKYPERDEMFLNRTRTRLDPPIPAAYFGNCISGCILIAKTTVLTGKEGFIAAVKLMGENLHELLTDKDGILKDKVRWEDLFSDGVPTTMISIAGTPKIKLYDLDFGWGKPKKPERISLDYGASISIDAGKESDQDLEIGVCLTSTQMHAFVRFLDFFCLDQQSQQDFLIESLKHDIHLF